MLGHAVEHKLQFPKGHPRGLKQSYDEPGPQQVTAGKMPGAEIHVDEADSTTLLVPLGADGLVEEQADNEHEKASTG